MWVLRRLARSSGHRPLLSSRAASSSARLHPPPSLPKPQRHKLPVSAPRRPVVALATTPPAPAPAPAPAPLAAVATRKAAAAAVGAAASSVSAAAPHRPPSLRARVDCVLSAVEQPAKIGFGAAAEVTRIGLVLVGGTLLVVGEAYRVRVHFRLRRLLRFAVGVPFLFCSVYLLAMRYRYFPERRSGRLDTSSVAQLPLCETVDDLLHHTLRVRWRYRRALRHSRGADTLSAEETSEALAGLLLIIRSIEGALVGTAEERALIETRADLLSGDGANGAGRPTSPAEFVLRVVLSVALEQGWFDVVEGARALYADLVHGSPLPMQARVVEAVGDLCTLSYELEDHKSGAALTLEQRRRFARAIDSFRPERAVEERSTIAAEISVLPLVDGDRTTRCLSMIRHSPGRKSQLVMCFIGSNRPRNWLTNFNFLSVPLPDAFGVAGGARVHRGFLQLLRTVRFAETAADYDQIILVGHSLGGALAQLAGLYLAAERPSRRITVITMASPRVLAVDRRHRSGGADDADTAAAEAPPAHPRNSSGSIMRGPDAVLAARLQPPPNYRHFRGFVQADIVPKLPPTWLFHYAHVGRRIPLNSGCQTPGSFLGWGFWSGLFHNSDFYGRVLRVPSVAQTHTYIPQRPEEGLSPADVAHGAAAAVTSM